MNNRGKGVVGLTLAAIMIASIFAVIAPTGADDDVEILVINPTLSKEADEDVYEIGETITFSMSVINPDPTKNMTLDVWDLPPDQYPDGTWELVDTMLTLKPGQMKSLPDRTYVVQAEDIVGGYIYNTLRATGYNNKTPEPERVESEVELPVRIALPCSFDFTFEDACCKRIRFTGISGGAVINHTWNFGDDVKETYNGKPGCVVHEYPVCGEFEVTLSGFCEGGVFNATSHDVYVDCGPTAVAKAKNVTTKKVITCFEEPGEMVEFDGTDSTFDTRPIVSYKWEFSDEPGVIYPGAVVTHWVDQEITATLKVNDSHCESIDILTLKPCAGCKIRLYGTFDAGPGNHTATDPEPGPSYGKKPENPPYTDPIAPFYPEAEQAPEKDFITFNPAIMVHNEGYPELDFVLCDEGEIEGPEEKVFKRMWYEKEWFKDRDGDGCWDVVIEDKDGKYVKTLCLAQEELIHAELMKGNRIREHNNPEDPDDPDHVLDADTYGPALKQEFAYMFLDGNRMPVMIQSGSEVLIPMASYEEDNGIDSFDALLGDGVTRDAVKVKSEATLGFDIDQDGKLEPMDKDNIELNGNESVVLVLDEKRLHIGDEIQFFDHKVKLTGITGPTGKTATFLVSDNEGGTRSDNPTINEGGIKFFYRAKEYTGTGSKPAFYVKVGPINWDVNPANIVAVVEVGRMFGQTHANIGLNLYWSQKAFIVDEVFYNVVAIKAEDDCIKYIVFREKLPKDDIKLYGKELKAWPPRTTLPEMPPFNDVHEIIVDVQDTGWTPSGVPIVKVGRKIPRPALDIKYADEDIEERFKGELKEIYNETYIGQEEKEFWMTEWFWTKPDQYTEIVLPPLESYLMTLAWYAPESVIHIWDDDPAGPIVKKTGERVKFLYNPMDNTDIYVNRISGGSDTQPATLLEYYDQLLYVGDGDGDPDRNEVIRAILDYLDSLEEPTYPFEPEGPFAIDDLIEYILAYLYTL